MRFVVDIYRYIVIGACGFLVILAALAIMLAFSTGAANLPGYVIVAAICGLLLLVLNLGGIAILISIHDRHVEIAENTEDVAIALDQVADRIGEAIRSHNPVSVPGEPL